MTDVDMAVLNFSPASLQLLNAILAIVMFSVALDLTKEDFGRLRKAPKPLITGLFSQLIALPVLTFGLILLFEPRPSIALGMILVAACPGGNISNFLTHRAGGNAALSVSMTAFSTVMAVFMTPINVAFWGSLYGPTREILRATEVDPVQIAITVTLMLILPLILGITLNTKKPELAARIRKPLQMLSMLIFVAFIVIALAANWANFKSYAGAVAVLVFVHNAVALGCGYTVATVAGMSDYNRRSITIETGIQNSGLGLVLIFAFFDGLGGMAVTAAAWGIWHAISGLGMALMWSRKPATQ